MSTPRLLMLVDSLATGGAERQFVGLCAGLRRGGRYEIVLGVLDAGGSLYAAARQQAAVVADVRRRARFDVTAGLRIVAAARRERVRLIHAQGWMAGIAGLAAARRLRLPVVYSGIGDQPSALSARQRLSRFCALRSDAAVANSRAALVAYGLERHATAHVIWNGVELAPLTNAPRSQTSPAICMVGNFHDGKDQSTLVRAFALLRRMHGGAMLVLVGHDAGTLAAVEHAARAAGVSGAVRFVTDTDDPAPIVAASDVCVLSSPSEGASNAILEYMSAAKPVVATECAGNADLVVHGENGFLVPFGDPRAMAERVSELLGDRALARSMGLAGKRRVEERFTLDHKVRAHEALYDRLLSG